MTAPTVKLNSACFDYYILRIKENSPSDEIENKLKTLRDFDPNGVHLVIEVDELNDIEAFAEQIKRLDVISNKFAMTVDFILANQYIRSEMIAGKPVINLSSTIKSAPIINKSLLIEEPVRSGIVVKNDGDVIVTSLVSHNAEIIASGNIHIYGECRGRVIAGNGGNKQAKIFIGKFNAELISIGGIYRAMEENLQASLHNKAVQIFLDEKDRLNIIPLAV